MTLEPPVVPQWHVEFADGHTATVEAVTEADAITAAIELWERNYDTEAPPVVATPIGGLPVEVSVGFGGAQQTFTYAARPGGGHPNPKLGDCPQCGAEVRARQSFALLDRTVFCSDGCLHDWWNAAE